MAEEQQPLIRVLGFETRYTTLPVKGDPLDDVVDMRGFKVDDKGRRVLEHVEEDWVTFAPSHSPLNAHTTERIRHMKPTPEILAGENGEKTRFMVAKWSQIEPHYDAWKKGNELPLNGTPLSAWPNVNAGMADILKQSGIRTVEEVANLMESQLEKIRLPNMRELRSTAVKFLENKTAAASAERDAARDARVEALEEQLAAAMELLEEKSKQPDEVSELRAQLDERGIKYHHKAGPDTLRALLNEEAA